MMEGFESRVVVLLLLSGASVIMCTDMTKENAMDYLTKYYYMGTNNPDPRLAALSQEDGYEMGILSFQRMHRLNETGILDEATKALMSLPRCGLPDVMTEEDTYVNMGEEGNTRRKRFVAQGSKWGKTSLTYKITVYTPDLSQSAVDTELRRAFGVWEMVTDLRFTQVPANRNADITILFGGGAHGDDFPFDGPSKTLAHAFFPQFGGDSHFDESETWTINTYNGVNLLQVAAHEFGHALGLSHSTIDEALMAPFYRGYQPEFMLHSDDVAGIQSIYGAPTTNPATTSTTRPEVTTRGREQTPRASTPRPAFTTTTPQPENSDLADLCQSGSFDTVTQHQHADGTVRTYVFRKDYYAEIDNDLIVPGYPRKINEGFPGLPNNLDAAIYWGPIYNSYYVWNNGWTRVEKLVEPARTYFFKGSQYWRVRDGAVDSGYPKAIGSAWGLPNNLDAAIVWSRNGKSYFFKGNSYYRFSRNQGLDGGYPRSIAAWDNALIGGIDSAVTNGESTLFTRDSQYFLYDSANIEVFEGYPRNSNVGILGCNRLQLVDFNSDGSNDISGASSLVQLQSVLTTCLVIFFSVMVMM